MGGWVAGSYSDIKTNLSQVGLDLDWPTGLSLAKSVLGATVATSQAELSLSWC